MPSEKSRFIQRCVADVTAQGKELGAAFAICTAQSQKSGYSKPGSSTMTGKGAARERAFKNADDMQAKSAEYERAVQKGRQEEISMRDVILQLEGRDSRAFAGRDDASELQHMDRMVQAVAETVAPLVKYLDQGHGYSGSEGRAFDAVTKAVWELNDANKQVQAAWRKLQDAMQK